jgi:hypothetical protein
MRVHVTDFKVEIPLTCDRTGRTERVAMTLDEAANMQKHASLKKEMSETIEGFLKGLPPETPDLVVMFRGKVVVLNTVLATRDNTVLRLLHDLTQSDTFPETATDVRKNTDNGGKRKRLSTVGS